MREENIKDLSVNERFEYKDGELFWKHHPLSLFGTERAWKAFNTKHAGKKVGRNVNGYLYVPIKRRHYSIHRIIFFMFNGCEPYIVDHIDGNPLNNKIENLRAATNSQNQANTKLSKRNTSGYKGVYFHKSTGLWQASVRKDKKLIHLWLFKNIEDAVKARRSHFEVLHGEFTRHE